MMNVVKKLKKDWFLKWNGGCRRRRSHRVKSNVICENVNRRAESKNPPVHIRYENTTGPWSASESFYTDDFTTVMTSEDNDGSAQQQWLNQIPKNPPLCTNDATRQNLESVLKQGVHIWRPKIIERQTLKVVQPKVMPRMVP